MVFFNPLKTTFLLYRFVQPLIATVNVIAIAISKTKVQLHHTSLHNIELTNFLQMLFIKYKHIIYINRAQWLATEFKSRVLLEKSHTL